MLPVMGGSNASNPQGRDILSDLKEWWNRNGLFTKSLTYITATFLVLSMIFDSLGKIFINEAALTLLRLQRIYFIHYARLMNGLSRFDHSLETFYSRLCPYRLLIVYLALLPSCSIQERQWGTLKITIDFFVKNFEIHMACNFLFLFLNLFISGAQYFQTYGLWSFFMVFLTTRCLQEPNGFSMFCCLPIQIPNKWYPLLVILLFSLLASGSPRIDMLMGYLVALVHFKYLDEKYHAFLNTARISSWENSTFCSCLQLSSNFISATGTASADHSGSAPQASNVSSGNRDVGPQEGQQQQAAIPFTGKGVTIGGTDPNDRDPQAGKSKKNYNQLGEETEDDIESNSTDNPPKN